MEYEFYNNCVNWEHSDLESLENIIDQEQEVSYEQFIKQIPLDDILKLFPFYFKNEEEGLTLQKDWAVRFFKSTFNGKKCLFIRHSAIEYVFIPKY